LSWLPERQEDSFCGVLVSTTNLSNSAPVAGLKLKKTNQAAGKIKTLTETWFVYLLRCNDGSLYTGVAKDVIRRCEQHNAGTASRYTRSRIPVRVEYQESHVTRSLALKREAAIKAMLRQEKEALIRFSG